MNLSGLFDFVNFRSQVCYNRLTEAAEMSRNHVYWESDNSEAIPANETHSKTVYAFVEGVDSDETLKKFLKKNSTKRKQRISPSNKDKNKQLVGSKYAMDMRTCSKQLDTEMKPEELLTSKSSSQTQKTASLKDLRPEDKLRIAELIKELARVGESKDKADQLLQRERNYFSKQIEDLENQKQSILDDRTSIMDQYKECQQLLSQYQKQITVQQEKLASDINELITPRKESPKQPSPNVRKSLFDALQEERKLVEDEKPSAEEVVVRNLEEEDMQSQNWTGILEDAYCKNNIHAQNELLLKKKEDLLLEQARLQELLKLHENQLKQNKQMFMNVEERKNEATSSSRFAQSSQRNQFESKYSPQNTTTFMTDIALPITGTQLPNYSDFSSNPYLTPIKSLNPQFSITPINSAGPPHHLPTNSAKRNLSSDASTVRQTFSSGSKHKTESTARIEEDETLTELLDTLNNSPVSVTLQKSSSDSGHHSLSNKSRSEMPPLKTSPFQSLITSSEAQDPELDDSQLLEEIFFIK